MYVHISHAIGQQHTVLTVDQVLYCKLVEMKWAMSDYQKKRVTQLGGLHISMCFQKAIGNHMKGLGLVEAWVESGLLKHEGALYKEVFPGKIEAHLSVTVKVRGSNSKWRAI